MSAITFDDADTLEAVVFQAIGAGSVCWESLEGTGVFQDGQAREVGEAAVARIRALLAAGAL